MSYVVVEGLDGSYKTTVVEKIAEGMNKLNLRIKTVRQMGGTELAEELRKMVKINRDNDGEKLTIYAETMIILAARSQLFEGVILPNLENDIVVISDRCNLSTIAYQSCMGQTQDYILNLIHSSPWYIPADLLIIIEVPVELAVSRLMAREGELDRLEKRLSHCADVYTNFNSKKIAKRVVRIPAILDSGVEMTSDEIAEIALSAITDYMKPWHC